MQYLYYGDRVIAFTISTAPLNSKYVCNTEFHYEIKDNLEKCIRQVKL